MNAPLAAFPWEPTDGRGPRRDTRIPANAIVPYPVAQTIGTRQYLWLRRCPTCRKARVYPATKATCGRSCGVSLSAWRRPDQERRMRELHKLAMQTRHRKQQERIAALCRGLTAEDAYRIAYERGYAAGHAAKRKGRMRLSLKASA